MTCLFLVIFVLPALAAADFTDYKEPFTLECEPGNVINLLISYHNDRHGDRMWFIHCLANPVNDVLSGCRWTDFVNDYESRFDFTCPNNGAISGISSEFNSKKKDRRFKFLCCNFSDHETANCILGNYANDWNAYLDFYILSSKVMAGVASKYDTHSDDRRFRFRVCDLIKSTDPGIGK